MDTTIVAALISGGVGVIGIAGAVVTSVVGSKDTRNATERAIAAARDDRLLERRCAAYEEYVAGLLHRREQRREVLEDGEMEKWSEQELAEFIVSYASPDAARVQAMARLVPYASDAVVKAVALCGAADGEVWKACAHLRTLTIDSQSAVDTTPETVDEALLKARATVDSALQQAEHRDLALIQAIRDELHRPLTELPAQREGGHG